MVIAPASSSAIRKFFSSLPKTYELINHIITLGLDVLWRKKAARIASSGGSETWLDVCSGTGDMAYTLAQVARPNTKIVALDFCLPMLSQATKKPGHSGISFCVSEAGSLPFADNTFDVITISFATRNLNSSQDILLERFREFRRVLKLGGRFINLETSQPKSALLRKLFHFYIRLMVKPIGYMISGSKTAYAYLSYTIPCFFGAEELAGVMYRAGFKRVDFTLLSFGVSAVHTAIK